MPKRTHFESQELEWCYAQTHLVILESPWSNKGQLGVLPGNVILMAAIFVILCYRADTCAGGHHFGILPLVCYCQRPAHPLLYPWKSLTGHTASCVGGLPCPILCLQQPQEARGQSCLPACPQHLVPHPEKEARSSHR